MEAAVPNLTGTAQSASRDFSKVKNTIAAIVVETIRLFDW
jgi:hypothetical protein